MVINPMTEEYLPRIQQRIEQSLILVYRKRKSDGSGYNEEVHGEKHQI